MQEASADGAERLNDVLDGRMPWVERAAVEGLLALVRPELSVAIGTVSVGFLHQIASYSGEVHVIDQTPPTPELRALPHVHFHPGDCSEQLAELLRTFAAGRRNIAFVMVACDQAPEDAQETALRLVESDATCDTIMVLHDTLNARLRSTLDRVALERLPKIAALQFDVVSGHVIQQGDAHAELCGGLAVIRIDARGRPEDLRHRASRDARSTDRLLATLTDVRTSGEDDDRERPASRTVDELEQELRTVQGDRDRLAAGLAEARRNAAVLVNSRSWRLTRPLRDVEVAITTRRSKITSGRSFVEDLMLLNDTLATTDLAGHYWVWAGLLLGWAREGRPLRHDSGDADFGVRSEELALFARAIPALADAGFEPSRRCITNDRRASQYQFLRDGATFDFCVMEPTEGRLHYYEFKAQFGQTHIQALASIPDQPLEAFEVVERSWLKHVDHDAELTTLYGDWHTPDTAWDYMHSPAIIERTTWTRFDESVWPGEFGDLSNEHGA